MMIANGRNTRFDFDDMDFTRLDQLSEKELEDLKSRTSRNIEDEQPDLRSYQKMRDQEATAQRNRGATVLERVLYAFGFTPERSFSKKIVQAERLYHTYTRSCDDLGDLLDTQSERIIELNQTHQEHAEHFQVCQAHYVKKRERVDRLEAELEASDQSGLHAGSYELRQQLTSARIELRSIEHETNDAQRRYVSARDELQMTELQNRDLSSRLSQFERQRNAFGVLLGKWKIEQKLSVGGSSPSMRETYQELAILAQDMEAVLEDGMFTTGTSVDDTYAIRMGRSTGDALVENWQRIQGA